MAERVAEGRGMKAAPDEETATGGRLLIRGGDVYGPEGLLRADVLVAGGRVVEVGKGILDPRAREVDASGMLVLPGLVDLHAHLREPGGERSETVFSGCSAAVAGGYTAVVAMPNTTPPIDSEVVLAAVESAARKAGLCHVEVAACVSRGRLGFRLTEMATLAERGVRLFTDDGSCIRSARLLRLALMNSAALGFVVADHPEDLSLVGEDPADSEAALVEPGGANAGPHGPGGPEVGSAAGKGATGPGVMNEGPLSEKLGLKGRPREAEEVVVARDLAVLAAVGGRLHLQHVTTRESLDHIRRAKEKGLAVTAEVTPHHLVFTEEALASYDPLYKVNPPLRTADDSEALVEGIASGLVDAVATDHAPHPPESKMAPLDVAPAGIAGIQVAFPLLYTEFVCSGALQLSDLVRAMSLSPARVLGLGDQGCPISEGAAANFFVFDPSRSWVFDPSDSFSAARATPYTGRKFTGKVVHTVAAGRLVFSEGQVHPGGAE